MATPGENDVGEGPASLPRGEKPASLDREVPAAGLRGQSQVK